MNLFQFICCYTCVRQGQDNFNGAKFSLQLRIWIMTGILGLQFLMVAGLSRESYGALLWATYGSLFLMLVLFGLTVVDYVDNIRPVVVAPYEPSQSDVSQASTAQIGPLSVTTAR